MPPQLAFLLTVAFIVYLFRRDLRENPDVTRALWLPFTWMVISGSRAVSEWLGLFGISVGPTSLEEGSPLDRLLYIGLICAGFYVLRQRRVQLAQLMRDNQWLAAFLIYCLLAVLWSDFPFVALKRWVKVVGHPIMALVILTEPNPRAALTAVMKRSAYILIPISVLFVKYFPQYGRGYETWTGAPLYTGITTNKNLLGCDCLILGFFFSWHFFETRRGPRTKRRRGEMYLAAFFLAMTCWLLNMANSKTSLASMGLGIGLLIFTGLRGINRRQLGTYIVVGILVLVSAEMVFGIYDTTLRLLGRDATLTERTFLWKDLFAMNINPLLGAGFESFWMGERLQYLWGLHPWRPNQAHNGYFETYLNLGLIGLFMLIGVLFATYRKATRALLVDFGMGRFRLGFLASLIVYNWTEAGFKTLSFIFFAFYLIAIDYRKPAVRPVAVASPEPGLELVPERQLQTATT